MANGAPQAIDLWDVMDEAEETVERWPHWQQRIEADVFYDDEEAVSAETEWWSITAL
jgi:hypothetical protein